MKGAPFPFYLTSGISQQYKGQETIANNLGSMILLNFSVTLFLKLNQHLNGQREPLQIGMLNSKNQFENQAKGQRTLCLNHWFVKPSRLEW